MKLETTLIELSALVEYGSQYLIDRTEMANKNAFDLYNLTSLADFMEYADLDDFDLLDHIDKSTIIEHLSNTYSIEDVFDEYDINEYLANEYDSKNYLNSLSLEALQEYIKTTYDVADFVEWI